MPRLNLPDPPFFGPEDGAVTQEQFDALHDNLTDEIRKLNRIASDLSDVVFHQNVKIALLEKQHQKPITLVGTITYALKRLFSPRE